MLKQALYSLILVSLVVHSCNKAEDTPPIQDSCKPTYTNDIKAITDSKCATSGCHDGSGSLASFTEYQSLKIRVDNGRLQTHVIEKKIMPPASTAPLTETELETFKCWLDNGAPEN